MGGDVRLGGKQFRGVPQTLSTGAATPDSPSQTFSVRLPPMRNLTTILCLIITKDKKMQNSAIFMIFAFLLGGCASASRVHETSPGIFTVTATGDGYTTADRVFDLVTTKANDKCAKKGKF